jgi:hypothetical protein
MAPKNLLFFVNLLDIGVNPEIMTLRFGCRLTHLVGPTSTHLAGDLDAVCVVQYAFVCPRASCALRPIFCEKITDAERISSD